MNILIKIAVALIISLVNLQLQAQENYSITVTVEDADSDDGNMFFALYNAEANFLKTPITSVKSSITNNECTVTFKDIAAGTYAVSIFHDENDNSKMDTTFFGIPKEDYGCSNDAMGFMGPPKWEDAKFELKTDKIITITL